LYLSEILKYKSRKMRVRYSMRQSGNMAAGFCWSMRGKGWQIFVCVVPGIWASAYGLDSERLWQPKEVGKK
jgi:hypothetical protein